MSSLQDRAGAATADAAARARAEASARARAVETLALTLYAEAGLLPVRAIEALAGLVVNRARAAAGTAEARTRYAPAMAALAPTLAAALPWPLLLGAVCRAPFLFPCWNPRHPAHALLAELPAGDPALAVCRRIAARAAAGALTDASGGATHVHPAPRLPGWAVGLVPCAEVAGLVFYRLDA